jgi:hypothetical protein
VRGVYSVQAAALHQRPATNHRGVANGGCRQSQLLVLAFGQAGATLNAAAGFRIAQPGLLEVPEGTDLELLGL